MYFLFLLTYMRSPPAAQKYMRYLEGVKKNSVHKLPRPTRSISKSTYFISFIVNRIRIHVPLGSSTPKSTGAMPVTCKYYRCFPAAKSLKSSATPPLAATPGHSHFKIDQLSLVRHSLKPSVNTGVHRACATLNYLHLQVVAKTQSYLSSREKLKNPGYVLRDLPFVSILTFVGHTKNCVRLMITGII